MALDPDELNEIENVLSASEAGASALAELRRRFPHLTWLRCDASDVIETPFRSYARLDLHLLDSSDHCVRITADPAQATGIVLAARSVA
jgi:hypothetical protein